MPTAAGGNKYIETPEKLWSLFQDFMAWVALNPYKKQDWVGKDAVPVERLQDRPITFAGFEKWLAITGVISDLRSYEQNDNDSYTAYLPIIARIRKICNGDIIEGAAANVYNANIAARVAGLTDKTESKIEVNKPFVLTLTDTDETN
jgi:hypothetical protein